VIGFGRLGFFTLSAENPREVARQVRGAAMRQKHPRAAQLVTPLGCVM